MSEIHALSGAYVVDAVDDLERAAFERHLVDSPSSRSEVASLRETAAVVAAAEATAPPAALRAAVLAEIRTVRPLPPRVPVQEVARRSRWFPRVVAAAVAAIALATGLTITHQSASHDPSAQVMQAADAQVSTVSLPSGGKITVAASRSLDKAVVMTKDLRNAPTGRTYELWLKRADGTFIPAGLMRGGGTQTVLAHGDAAHAVGLGITVEPASGSTEPTTAPIAMFPLRST